MNWVNFFIILFLHSVSQTVWGSHYDPYAEAVANSECGVFYMDSPWPFNITETHSKSLSLMIPPSTRPTSVIPVVVTVTAKTAGGIASTVSIATFSPGVVTQANRIGTVMNVLACNDGSAFEIQPLDWSLSPTQISLGDGMLQYVDGAVLGNWVLFAGIAATYTLLAKKIGEMPLRYPGYLILPGLFLSSSTTRSAVTMIRLGNAIEKACGSISLLGQIGLIGWIGHLFMPSRFEGVIEYEPFSSLWQSLYSLLPGVLREASEQKWRPKEESSPFIKYYGVLFMDYRQDWYGFMVPELFMTMASGVLDSFQVDPKSSCSTLLYTSTGVYGVYAMSLVALHPHRQRFDRIYFGSVACTQFSALAIGSLQKMLPSLQNSTTLQTVAEGIPLALQYITLARSVYDLSVQIKSGYNYFRKGSSKKSSLELLVGPIIEDDKEMLSLQPVLQQEEFESKSSTESSRVSVDLSVPAVEQLEVPLLEEEQSKPQDRGISRNIIFGSDVSASKFKEILSGLFEKDGDDAAEIPLQSYGQHLDENSSEEELEVHL